ncbi:MAG TPA: xanthine dehydrogenase family protein subunit M [Methylomirabilota bacterium]|jgi:aerobic carbon-monoxide dehydrogenase medium subunit|nr:xanthine dehydrogenase family protein subunit M [Methylomirabilota bacterium]
MYPAQFEYHKASTVKEALDLLGKYKDEAKLLAGGHSLLPAMKLRLAQPKHLIDIGKVSGLSGVKEEGGTLVIGAMTTHYAIESSALLKSKCPLLPEVAGHIGDPMVRNMGTIGGSLAHADPAADWPAAAIALNADLVAEGPKGKRTIKADDFFKGLLTTALADDEILTEIRVPAAAANVKSAYVKFPHPASRFAVVGVAAVLTMDGGNVSKASIGITGAGSKAVRAKGVEAAITGKAADAASIQAAAEKGADGVDVQPDLQGSEEYKKHLLKVFSKRAIEAAAAKK